jgi:NADPH2:quinone reductase
MRAFRVTAFDSPPLLADLPPPRPGPGQVRLRITACGLNFADLLMAEGRYQDTPALPFTPGMEVCGIVTECGPGVTAPLPGARVLVFGGHGGLAEEGVFAADRCRPVPAGMEDTVAAGFQIAYGTSHLALTRRARLAGGETLVVLGAGGGVGLTAVEIGAALGARVIAVASDADKRAAARAAGAAETIPAAGDLRAALKALGPADVVFDPVGGAAFRAALSALRPEGRYLVVGFASGEVPQVAPNHLLVKNIDLIGFYWGGYLRFDPGALDRSLGELLDWHEAGRLHPTVSHVLPLERAGEGLALLRDRRAVGKVVIRP